MGVVITICNEYTNNLIIGNHDVDIKQKSSNIDKKSIDLIFKIIKKIFIHSCFIKLKNYYISILQRNNCNEEVESNKINNSNDIINKEEIHEENNKKEDEVKNDTLEKNQNKENKNDSKNKTTNNNNNNNNIPPKNNDSLLNSTMNVKSININEDNNTINDTNANEKNREKGKEKDKTNEENAKS